MRGSQTVLNHFRPRFDLPLTLARPPPATDLVDAALEVMIEEKIPVFSAGLGIPEPDLIERFHRAGTKVVSMVATVEDAKTAVANGVDVVAAQGSESGGHRSYGVKLKQSDPAQQLTVGSSHGPTLRRDGQRLQGRRSRARRVPRGRRARGQGSVGPTEPRTPGHLTRIDSRSWATVDS